MAEYRVQVVWIIIQNFDMLYQLEWEYKCL